METPDNSQQPLSNNAVQALAFFPKAHIVIAGALVSALIATMALSTEQKSLSPQTFALAIPELDKYPSTFQAIELEPQWSAPPLSSDHELDEIAEEKVEKSDLLQVELQVKSGDTLSTLFQRAGLKDKDMYQFVNSRKEAKRLEKLFPGHRLTFSLNGDKQLHSLIYQPNRLTSEVFTSSPDGGFEYEKIERNPEVKLAVSSGIIKSSLYKAGIDAGINEDLIMSLAGIFGWDIDFALDIRQGDSFKILYEEKFLDGKKLGTGSILAAEFINQNSTYRAVRYVEEDGVVRYYSPTGKAMRKAFLRAPLDFRRISSNFNPRRLHPITKTVRPHRGTDYAADRGTPVWAAGDGRVIASGYTEANGNYVVIQHGADIQTKYLHLHKRNVKKGDRIRQKQTIGTVGSTGYSTAPHLHYEFLVNGVHRDPRTIVQKLPKSESIPANELQRFKAQTQPLVAQLEQLTSFASNNIDAPPKL